MNTLRLSVSLLLILTAACSRSTTGHRVIHSEIDGIPLVRTEGGPLHDGPIFELTSDFILGTDEDEPEWQVFGGLWPIYASDGRVVLGDYRRSEVFIVSREGDLLHRLGGEGDGPGEFRNLSVLHWVDLDREFWVEDFMRINRFSMDGEYLGSINRTPLMMKNIMIQPLGRDRLIGSYGERQGERSVTVHGLLNADLEWIADFMIMDSSPGFQTTERGYRPIPFTAGDGCSATPDGRILVTRPNEGRIELYSIQGELQQFIERDWEYAPVTGEDKEALRKRYRESSRPESQRMAETFPFPDRYPAFRRATMDDSGRIWVERYPKGSYMSYDGPCTYDIFASDGVWFGTQQFDFSFRVCGDHAYRQFYAESGSPRLERFRMTSLVGHTESR